MEGIHVGFGRRICTDASSKPLPITTVLSAVFSSPWHKSDGQNCVAPAMERFSSEFWCGGRRNTRVFQGRQAGNHRKSPMSGGTDPFHVYPRFLPANLSFVILLFFALLLDDYPYRRTLKAVGVSEAVFDISLIREVEQLGAVAENHKRRRLYSRLGHIIQL